jgi:hypothetical protein
MPRIVIVLTLLVLLAAPARAQLVVVDPGNLIQAILIAERTLRQYEVLRAQFQTIQRMAQGLGASMEGYRIPVVPTIRHDVSRWEYGRPWLAGMNSGDPTGGAYWQTTRQLERPPSGLQGLPAPSRRAIEQAYATIEIADSVAQLGGHQVALIRQQNDRLQRAIGGLEGDVLNGLARYHEMTANLDKIAAAELLARRQDMSANQLLSHALEQLLVRGKRLRDSEAVVMDMRLRTLVPTNDEAGLLAGAAEHLRTWRQP